MFAPAAFRVGAVWAAGVLDPISLYEDLNNMKRAVRPVDPVWSVVARGIRLSVVTAGFIF